MSCVAGSSNRTERAVPHHSRYPGPSPRPMSERIGRPANTFRSFALPRTQVGDSRGQDPNLTVIMPHIATLTRVKIRPLLVDHIPALRTRSARPQTLPSGTLAFDCLTFGRVSPMFQHTAPPPLWFRTSSSGRAGLGACCLINVMASVGSIPASLIALASSVTTSSPPNPNSLWRARSLRWYSSVFLWTLCSSPMASRSPFWLSYGKSDRSRVREIS